MVDIDAIEEAHHEQFCERVLQDQDLSNLVAYYFLCPMDYYLYCKEGFELGYDVLAKAFDALYTMDAEWLVEDALGCLEMYGQRKRHTEFILKNWPSVGVEA